jgi:anti-sigma B factor antagonist
MPRPSSITAVLLGASKSKPPIASAGRPFEPIRLLTYNACMDFEPLEIERPFSDMGGRGVLRLKGPLISENLSDFQNAMRRENVPTMILDLTGVPYIDSAGLGSLVSAYVSRHKSGHRTVLTGVNPRIVHLLEITRMAQLFPIFPSLADALDALSNSATA